MFKASLTTIIGALVLQAGAHAQIYVKSPGDVGIGIQTPASKLHINGVTTAGPANGGYHLVVNDAPNARWALGTGNYGFHFASDYPVSTTWEEKFVITRDRNVGIGITNPTATVTLPNKGNASLRVGINSNMANTHTQLINSLAVLGDTNTTISSCGAVAWDYFNNGNNPSWSGTVLQHVGTGVAGNQYGVQAANQGVLVFNNVNNGVIAANGQTNIFVSQANNVTAAFLWDGRVGIGTTSPEQKLHVNGYARAWAFIANGNTWADYVFDSAYQLPSLADVKKYINQHHHLPDVPSAEEVKKDGVNISENQVILLKKIEELTLYVIDQNEKYQVIEKKLNAVLEENEALKAEKKNKKK